MFERRYLKWKLCWLGESLPINRPRWAIILTAKVHLWGFVDERMDTMRKSLHFALLIHHQCCSAYFIVMPANHYFDSAQQKWMLCKCLVVFLLQNSTFQGKAISWVFRIQEEVGTGWFIWIQNTRKIFCWDKSRGWSKHCKLWISSGPNVVNELSSIFSPIGETHSGKSF